MTYRTKAEHSYKAYRFFRAMFWLALLTSLIMFAAHIFVGMAVAWVVAWLADECKKVAGGRVDKYFELAAETKKSHDVMHGLTRRQREQVARIRKGS